MWNNLIVILIYLMAFLSVAALTIAVIPELRAKVEAYLGTMEKTSEVLENMFVLMPRRKLTMIYIASPIGLSLMSFLLVKHWLVIPVGLLVGTLVPRLYVRALEMGRHAKFRAQLVDALMVLSGAMKAGMSILQSLEVLVEESISPMSEEIGLVLKETRMGLSLDESLKRFKNRMPLDEVNLLVTAMLVARETGGDITTVFAQLIETIRERHKLRERLKTLTTIPRLQGWIMAVIPLVFAGFVTGIDPNYFQKFLHDPTGQMIGVVGLVLWVLSLFMIFVFSKSPL